MRTTLYAMTAGCGDLYRERRAGGRAGRQHCCARGANPELRSEPRLARYRLCNTKLRRSTGSLRARRATIQTRRCPRSAIRDLQLRLSRVARLPASTRRIRAAERARAAARWAQAGLQARAAAADAQIAKSSTQGPGANPALRLMGRWSKRRTVLQTRPKVAQLPGESFKD